MMGIVVRWRDEQKKIRLSLEGGTSFLIPNTFYECKYSRRMGSVSESVTEVAMVSHVSYKKYKASYRGMGKIHVQYV